MSVLKLEDAEIYYEEFGEGYPVLLFAPGGMRSRSDMWHSPPDRPPRVWNDWTEVLAETGSAGLRRCPNGNILWPTGNRARPRGKKDNDCEQENPAGF